MDQLTQLAYYSFYETERLYLRPFTIMDSEAFYEISSNPENLSFIFPMCQSRAESDYLLVHRFLKRPLGIWAIEEKASGSLIGAITFDKLDWQNREAEIGYFVRRKCQNQGFATEALKNLVYLSFDVLGLKRLALVTHLENKASQAVAQKAGFTLVKQFKGSDRYTKRTRQYLAFEMTAGERYE